MIIIGESTDIIKEASTDRKYKCPYCDYRDTRENLVSHVENEHEEMIPKNYTPARVIFNYINRKDHGSCVICGRETKWNEDNWRYDRLCPNMNCEKKFIENFRANMKKAGKENQMNDPEHQKKMIEGRSISGKYTFKTDSGIRSYTGKNEMKFLQFMDTVFHETSKNIITPGPVIEYEFEGKKLFWITDAYYVPFNLVIDVKDGGDNPNNRPMPEYRAKQVAKEKAIAEQKQYNYLRLTDNNMEQIMLIMAEIKYTMSDNNEDKIIHINEDMGMMMGSLPPAASSEYDSVYIVPYIKKGEFNTKYGITRDPSLDRVFTVNDDGEIEPISKEELSECIYSIYKYKGEDGMKKYKSILENVIFSKSDYTQHLDLWKAGTSNNVLYITGHSGSGKSTLASKMEIEKKAIYIELDLFEHKRLLLNPVKGFEMSSGDEYIYNYITKVEPRLKSIDFKNYPNDKFHDEFVKFFNWLHNELSKDKDNLFVVEGVQLFTHVDLALLKGKPLIVKGTSVIRSMINRQKRDSTDGYGNAVGNWKVNFIKFFPEFYKWYLEKEKQLSRFKDNVHESYDNTYFYEKLTDKKLLSEDQLEFDPDFEEVEDIYTKLNNISESIIATIKNDNLLSLPVFDMKNMSVVSEITSNYPNTNINQDNNGYFAKNNFNQYRTKSYKTIIDIPKEALSFINKL